MSFFTRWIDYFGNHRTTFGLGILIIVAHLIIAAERVYVYRNAGPWVVIARIGGEASVGFNNMFTALAFRMTRPSFPRALLPFLLLQSCIT